MAGKNDFIYCDPPYIGRHVDYFDRWDEQAEISLHKALVDSKARFMLSTWDHNDYRQNDYIASVWGSCERIITGTILFTWEQKKKLEIQLSKHF